MTNSPIQEPQRALADASPDTEFDPTPDEGCPECSVENHDECAQIGFECTNIRGLGCCCGVLPESLGMNYRSVSWL